MAKSGTFTPKTQEALERTLEATRNAMAEVRDNVRILEQGRDRSEKRVERIKEELAQAKHALSTAVADKASLGEELRSGAAERNEIHSKLMTATDESDRLRRKLEEISGERNALIKKTEHFERLIGEKANLEAQFVKSAEDQEVVIAELTRQLEDAGADVEATGGALRTAKDLVAERDKQIEDLRRAHEKQQDEKDRLLAERDEAMAKRDMEVAENEKELERARETAQNLSADTESLRKQLRDSEEGVSDLTTQTEKSREAQETLKRELKDAKAIAEKQAQENDARADALKLKAAGLTKEKVKLTADLEEAGDAIEGMNAQLASEAELRKALEVDLDVARCAIRELKAALAEAHEEAVS